MVVLVEVVQVSWKRKSLASMTRRNANTSDSRRAQRDAMTANPWPPSPKAPARDL